MKKLILSFALALGISATASANKYTLDENQVDNMFANSTEISFEQKMSSELSMINEAMIVKGSDTKTRGGYLLRAFFCGGIALHRYYMGTNKKAMWAMYLCIPVFGGINGCVDFWWVVFDKEAMDKYANNDKYVVWL
jgi:hypothetical protein